MNINYSTFAYLPRNILILSCLIKHEVVNENTAKCNIISYPKLNLNSRVNTLLNYVENGICWEYASDYV